MRLPGLSAPPREGGGERQCSPTRQPPVGRPSCRTRPGVPSSAARPVARSARADRPGQRAPAEGATGPPRGLLTSSQGSSATLDARGPTAATPMTPPVPNSHAPDSSSTLVRLRPLRLGAVARFRHEASSDKTGSIPSRTGSAVGSPGRTGRCGTSGVHRGRLRVLRKPFAIGATILPTSALQQPVRPGPAHSTASPVRSGGNRRVRGHPRSRRGVRGQRRRIPQKQARSATGMPASRRRLANGPESASRRPPPAGGRATVRPAAVGPQTSYADPRRNSVIPTWRNRASISRGRARAEDRATIQAATTRRVAPGPHRRRMNSADVTRGWGSVSTPKREACGTRRAPCPQWPLL